MVDFKVHCNQEVVTAVEGKWRRRYVMEAATSLYHLTKPTSRGIGEQRST